MASLENTAEETFTIFWNIKNLRHCTLKNGESLVSPSFFLPNFQDTSWSLAIFPKGAHEDSSEYLSWFLIRELDDGPEKILIKCDFLTSYSKMSFEYIYSKSDCRGCEKYLSHAVKHISDFNFPVICILHYNTNVSKKSIFVENFCNSSLKIESENIALVTKKLNTVIDIETKKIKEQDLAMAKKCTLQTHFFIENKFFEWVIDESVINDDKCNKIFLVESLRKTYYLILILCRNSDFMNVFIKFVEPVFKESLLVLCKMSFFNGAESTVLFEKMHLFQKNNYIWSLEKAFEISVLETKLKKALPGMLKLKFEFTFSDGDYLTEILKESSYQTLRDIMPIYSSTLSNQMARLHNDEVLCDAELKVKNKSFSVHKFVLSLMSPVFTTMFSNEMEEKKTGVVDIVDFDEDVIGDMIYFLYNGTLKSFEFLRVHKLFSAADKYEIAILKKMCRLFLIENLTWENICPILSLADLHSDIELENAAIEIFCFYKTSILLSEDWKEFEKKNMSFAYNVFKKCMFLV